MKKKIFTFHKLLWSYGLTICICLFLMGCEKEVSDQLKGKWQLRTIEEAGLLTPVDTVWYNFLSEAMFMYQIYQPAVDSFLWLYGYKTQQQSHIIHLEFFSWGMIKEDFLPFTDWQEPTRTFTINKINNKQLVLHGDDKTYTFDRF